MRQQLPTSLTLQIDTREQEPFSFPDYLTLHVRHRGSGLVRINKVRTKLEAGDYRFAEYPHVGVERKRDIDEVYKNCTGYDWRRFRLGMERFKAAYKHRFLALPQPPHLLLRDTIRTPDAEKATDFLLGACITAGVHVILLPSGTGESQRVKAGELVLRTMFAAAVAGGVSLIDTPALPCECEATVA